MVELVRKHKNNGSSGVGITSTPIHEVFKLEYVQVTPQLILLIPNSCFGRCPVSRTQSSKSECGW